MAMAWRNIVAAAGLLAFGAWYAWLAFGLPERFVPNTPGPSFFPLVIAALIFVLSLALLFRGVADVRAARGGGAEDGFAPGGALTLVAFLVYLAVLPFAGFVIASVAFFAVLMVLYGSRKPLLIGAASTLIPLALFVVFRYGLQIVLPRGIWGF